MSREKKITIAVVILAVVSAVLISAYDRETRPASPQASPADMAAAPALEPALPEPPPVPRPDFSGSIQKNSSFFDVMMACGSTPEQVTEITNEARPVYDLGKIRPGQKYEVFKNADGGIETVRLSTSDETEYVEITCLCDSIKVERREYPYEISIKEVSGLITQSFYQTIMEEGLPLALGAMLVEIYAWDIDFFTDIRKNDYFRVIYKEKRMLDGPDHEEKTAVGDILAAEFNTSGDSRYCFLFDNDGDFADYFDYDGRSLRKQLLRAPLKYSRISSGYSRRRLHPVLHTYAPHLGIDYAAPTGTPVMSTGDGTVMTASRTRANGNYIKIRHNNSYISYYLHLSRFGRGIKPGAKVKQGQVIGYVGATGYATGPHLDYRIKKNGRFVNPRKLDLPPAKPVSEANLAAFTALRDSLVTVMRRVPVRDPRAEYYAEGEVPDSEIPASSGGGNQTPQSR